MASTISLITAPPESFRLQTLFMKKRPLSVTVIAWTLLVINVLSADVPNA